jgi:ribose transport system ATP-binding protein
VGRGLTGECALSVRHVSKVFGGVVALDDVALDVAAGEVHALIGVNGSGKSTLIKVLTGFHAPEPGAEMELWGNPVALPVRGHVQHGIAVLHQQTGLVDELTVKESVGVGVGYGARPLSRVSWRRERADCLRLSRTLGLSIDPDAVVGGLSASERTVVALLRTMREIEAAGRRPLYILDEPTTSFTPAEVDRLTAVIRRVADGGGSVIFISHKLQEVLALADRITVLRDGRRVGTLDRREATADGLIRLMLGDAELGGSHPPAEASGRAKAAPALRLVGVSGRLISGLSLEVRAGEIVGFTGLAGMGQDERPYLLCGDRAPSEGLIEVDGRPIGGVRANLRRRIALVPGDRAREGLWLAGSASENVTLPVLGRFFRRGRLRGGAERRQARETLARYLVRPSAPRLAAAGFSGGNQQKIVLAKSMQTEPRVLILHEPTVGVDVGAKAEIYDLVRASAGRGAAVVVCGSDYDEMAQLCDRVMVLSHGRAVTGLAGSRLTEARLASACNAAAHDGEVTSA